MIPIVHITIPAIEDPPKMIEDLTTHNQIASIGAVKDPNHARRDPSTQDLRPNIQDPHQHAGSWI